jgi:cystathionine beta-lyase
MLTTANYDALTVDDLTGVIGKKWNTFPGCIGAFIAEMDFATAPAVVEALHDAVGKGFFGYLPDALEHELDEAVSAWYRNTTGWEVPAAQVHSMPDVLKGLEIVLKMYAPRGGKVIVPTPAYMPFLMLPERLGREQVEVPMSNASGRWEYDLDAIDAAFKAGGEVLILCNPHNPIGRVLERDEMLAISEVVERNGGRVFSDEIHAPVIYPGHKHVPYASVSEAAANHTITAIAASKAWNLAGLKCAQIVLSNEADIAIWNEDGGWTAHGASSLGVVASIAAWTQGQEWLDDVIDYLDGNRNLLGDMIADLLPGVEYTKPEGTYLTWIDFTNTGLDGDLAEFFREKAGVALTGGNACGQIGNRAVRFNIAMPRPILERAVNQMADALRSI